MTILNLTVDDQIASRAEQVAKERNTTLNQLVSEFLEQLTPAEQTQLNSSADRLATTFRDLSRPLGGKPYPPSKIAQQETLTFFSDRLKGVDQEMLHKRVFDVHAKNTAR